MAAPKQKNNNLFTTNDADLQLNPALTLSWSQVQTREGRVRRQSMNHQEVKHEEKILPSMNWLWPSGSDEQVPPSSAQAPSTGTSEDRNQSDETDADIRWRIHLQLVSPELPLTAGALRYAVLPLQDSSISPAS